MVSSLYIRNELAPPLHKASPEVNMKLTKRVVFGLMGVLASLGSLKAAKADDWNYVRGDLSPSQVRRLVAPRRIASRRFLREFEAQLSAEDRAAFEDAAASGTELTDDLYGRLDEFGDEVFKLVCMTGQEPYFSDDEDAYCIDSEGNDFEPLELREALWDGNQLRICTLYYRESHPAYDVQDCTALNF